MQYRSPDGRDQLSVKVVNKGWQGVVDDEMCEQQNSSSSCPALVLAGTTQVGRSTSRLNGVSSGKALGVLAHFHALWIGRHMARFGVRHHIASSHKYPHPSECIGLSHVAESCASACLELIKIKE